MSLAEPANRYIRAELDAAFFHPRGLDRDEVDYVLGTFPIVRRKDERGRSEHLTKRLILRQYKTTAPGTEDQTILDPRAGRPSAPLPTRWSAIHE